MGFVKKSNAQYFLFMNTALWGSSYVWSKMLLDFLPRFTILFICSLGGLISTVILFFPSIKSIRQDEILPSIVISGLSILSNTFFMFALQYTSSSNTAFIVQMSVVITPVIIAFLERKMPERKMLLSAFAALAGLFLLTCDLKSFSVNAGDLFALGNAVFFSAFLAGLKFYSKKVEAVHFTFIHHGTNTIAFMTIAGIFELKYINPEKLAAPPFALLISASVLISIITVLLQSSSIKFVRAEKATLIYTLEPVTASILAFFFIGERLNGIGAFIGCCLILAAVVYSVFKPGRKGKRSYDAEPSISPLTE